MSSQSRTVSLVPCASRKLNTPAKARDLYTSALFLKMRAVVEQLGAPWFILSAKHGLLRPDERIDPYDLTLKDMGVVERRSWARKVIGQMEERLLPVERVIVLAGQSYREFLMDWLTRHASRVETPLAHLGIVRQLQFLDAWLRSARAGDRASPTGTHAGSARPPAATPALQAPRVGGVSGGSRYDPLRTFLQSRAEPTVELSFAEIAGLVGGLPRSAYTHRAWWANNRRHPQARAWLDAGRRISVEWSPRAARFVAD